MAARMNEYVVRYILLVVDMLRQARRRQATILPEETLATIKPLLGSNWETHSDYLTATYPPVRAIVVREGIDLDFLENQDALCCLSWRFERGWFIPSFPQPERLAETATLINRLLVLNELLNDDILSDLRQQTKGRGPQATNARLLLNIIRQ